MSTEREHDLVVFGATGFVGALLAEYLAEAAPAGLRIALAGRSRDKLERVRAGLSGRAHGWPLVSADSTDPASMRALAESTRVVATTVGPYARYGLPLVEACAKAGTHYCDLTGEVLFVHEAIARYDGPARSSGARIVHSCGYDSIPSDLGVLLVREAAGADLTDVRAVATARGGFSGGTLASLLGHVEAVSGDPVARRIAGGPHSISPDRAAEPTPDQPRDASPPRREADGSWTAPFVMAPYNTRIVRRSNALQDWAYGRGLRYEERMAAGKGLAGAVAAVAITGAMGAVVGAAALGPTRALLERVLPKPGTGPSARARAEGFFRHVLTGTTVDGRTVTATVAGPGDPGYAATAVMLGESALSLALDDLPDRAGSLTPATAMGRVLIERLREAGHTYEAGPR
ncbi:saccharopine dehydrogenase family protein [Pseudonocardia xishanensis]|uniref:Saccharopine dehydrogenase NADP-binding domain-containing protein n=1 Tax=Pseudonocardia xishanensis TaxID=630995 RepID=A0ABP8S205_9PSEU